MPPYDHGAGLRLMPVRDSTVIIGDTGPDTSGHLPVTYPAISKTPWCWCCPPAVEASGSARNPPRSARTAPPRRRRPGNRAVPGDPGATARRGGQPVSGRHRLARRYPADTRPKEPSRRCAAAAPRGGAGAGRLSEPGASGDRRTPGVRRAPGRSSRQAALEPGRLTCRGTRGSPRGSRRAARRRQRLPAHRRQPHGDYAEYRSRRIPRVNASRRANSA